MARILVTGGAGFIGCHLCARLVARGETVICLDNFHTGNRENVAPLADSPNFEIIEHDIKQPIKIDADRIFHLACPASPVHYQYNAIKTVKTNVLGIVNMLGMAKRLKARILQASTSEVYGDPLQHPQTESYWGNVNPLGIRACYDEGKRVAETLMMDYHRQNNVDIRVIIQFPDHICNIIGRSISFHMAGSTAYTDFFAGFNLVADIDFTSRIIADQ